MSSSRFSVAALVLVLAWTVPLAAAGAATARSRTVQVEAFTTPFRDLQIAAEVGGVVTAVEAEEGERVDAEQVLVRLRADRLRAELQVSKAQVEAARLEVEAATVNYKDLAREWEDVRKLVAKGVEAQEAEDKAKLEMDLAELGIRRAEVRKKIADLTVQHDEAALEETIIRAPCDGEVLRVMERPGEAVKPLSPVARLVTLDPLYVIAQAVPIETMGDIRVGMKGELVLENLPDRPLECTVAVVDRVADPASGTYRVKLTLPNPQKSLPSGAKGTLTFALGES